LYREEERESGGRVRGVKKGDGEGRGGRAVMCISVQGRIKADILSNLWGVGVMIVVVALAELSSCCSLKASSSILPLILLAISATVTY
jgi:hypothetical protein